MPEKQGSPNALFQCEPRRHLVVPWLPSVWDSGTEELVGLAGKMTIDIVDGKHFYGFDYTLGERR